MVTIYTVLDLLQLHSGGLHDSCSHGAEQVLLRLYGMYILLSSSLGRGISFALQKNHGSVVQRMWHP